MPKTAQIRKPAKRELKLSLIAQAAELVWREIDNLSDSAPRGTLNRLHDIAVELKQIEDGL